MLIFNCYSVYQFLFSLCTDGNYSPKSFSRAYSASAIAATRAIISCCVRSSACALSAIMHIISCYAYDIAISIIGIGQWRAMCTLYEVQVLHVNLRGQNTVCRLIDAHLCIYYLHLTVSLHKGRRTLWRKKTFGDWELGLKMLLTKFLRLISWLAICG
jgi:hypothetical protein